MATVHLLGVSTRRVDKRVEQMGIQHVTQIPEMPKVPDVLSRGCACLRRGLGVRLVRERGQDSAAPPTRPRPPMTSCWSILQSCDGRFRATWSGAASAAPWKGALTLNALAARVRTARWARRRNGRADLRSGRRWYPLAGLQGAGQGCWALRCEGVGVLGAWLHGAGVLGAWLHGAGVEGAWLQGAGLGCRALGAGRWVHGRGGVPAVEVVVIWQWAISGGHAAQSSSVGGWSAAVASGGGRTR
ncbi:hypothetical protein [Spirillospora sp. NPDC048819]|uniref:hypothetical protein n=1 Tax=Spirillospora sp. NPDC048819 TaxID=3155268 RepID=UPI0033E8BEEB